MRSFTINSIANTAELCVRGNDLLVATPPAYQTWHTSGNFCLPCSGHLSNVERQEIWREQEQVSGSLEVGRSPISDAGGSICSRRMFHSLFSKLC